MSSSNVAFPGAAAKNSEELTFNTAFYPKELIQQGINAFRAQAKITIVDENEKQIRLQFASADQHTSQEFANHLLALKRSQ